MLSFQFQQRIRFWQELYTMKINTPLLIFCSILCEKNLQYKSKLSVHTYHQTDLFCKKLSVLSSNFPSLSISSNRVRILLNEGLFLGSSSQHDFINCANWLGQLFGMDNRSPLSTINQATWKPSIPLYGTSLVIISHNTFQKLPINKTLTSLSRSSTSNQHNIHLSICFII